LRDLKRAWGEGERVDLSSRCSSLAWHSDLEEPRLMHVRLRVMTLSVVVLGASACVALGVIVRCGRDVAALRCLERLLEGCDQGERLEVCRILAASLQETGREDPRDELPPSEPVARCPAGLRAAESQACAPVVHRQRLDPGTCSSATRWPAPTVSYQRRDPPRIRPRVHRTVHRDPNLGRKRAARCRPWGAPTGSCGE
jgi:hypothetical protein